MNNKEKAESLKRIIEEYSKKFNFAITNKEVSKKIIDGFIMHINAIKQHSDELLENKALTNDKEFINLSILGLDHWLKIVEDI